MILPHPSLVLRRLGVREAYIGAAIGMLLALQLVYLAVIFRNYLIRPEGYAISDRGAFAALAVFVAVLFAGLLFWFRRIDRLRFARRRTWERPARHESFAQLRQVLDETLQSAGVHRPVSLYYHVKFADACYTLEVEDGARVVVGAALRGALREDDRLVRTMPAHEVSHVELGSTERAHRIRQWVVRYFVSLVLLVAFLALGLLLLTPEVKGGTVVASAGSGDWMAVALSHPNAEVFGRLTRSAILFTTDALAVFVFSYFFLIRRELAHDFRSCQLTGTADAALAYFHRRCSDAGQRGAFRRRCAAIRTFLGLHPTPCERHHRLQERDFVAVNAGWYPAVAGALFPATLLLALAARQVVGASEVGWNVAATAILGLLIHLVLRAEAVRFGIFALIGRFPWRKLLQFAGVLAGFAVLLGVLLVAWTAWYGEKPPGWLQSNLIYQVVAGIRLTVCFAAVIFLLSYLAGFRVALTGDNPSSRMPSAVEGFLMLIASCLIAAALSLTSWMFIAQLILALAAILAVYTILLIALAPCRGCGRRVWGAYLLRTRCRCGWERIPFLRGFVTAF